MFADLLATGPRRLAALALAGLVSVTGLSPAGAQDSVRLQFAPGATDVSFEGTVRGRDYVDHVVNARAGQTMVVNLAVTAMDGNGTVYYNILPAGQDFPALYNGSTAPDRRAEVTLPESGDWAIRVYQMGNDRDTGKTSGYALNVSISPVGASSGGSGGTSASGSGLLPEEDLFVVRTSGGPLNVRSAPRPSGTLLGQLENGTTVSNAGGCTISDGAQWCEVRAPGGGLRGWVSARFLELPRPGGGAPSAPAAPGGGDVVQVAGVASNDVLNVRAGPGTGNRIVGALGNGDRVRRLGCRNVGAARWCEIEMMTDMRERGWVNARFLSGQGGQATQLPGPGRTERVRFEAGTSGTEFSDQLGPGMSVTYLLGASAGQDLYFRLASDSADLAWRIFNPDGSLLDRAGPGREYSGQLFQSGDHRVEITNRGASARSYTVILGIR